MKVELNTIYEASLSAAQIERLIEAARSDEPLDVLEFFDVKTSVTMRTPEEVERIERFRGLASLLPGLLSGLSGINLVAMSPAEKAARSGEVIVNLKAPRRHKVQEFRFVGPEGQTMTSTIPAAADEIGCSYAAVYAIARGRNLTARGWKCLGKAVA